LNSERDRDERAVYSVLSGLLALWVFGSTVFGATPNTGVARESLDETHRGGTQHGIPKYPDVSATQIVFLFDGELWLVPREGGAAAPLTKEYGPRSFPKFSPDGQTIAFTGTHDGIYTIPVSRGEPTRITHNPGATDLCNWTPDGRLLFMTDTFFAPADFGEQAYLRELYTVAATGGLPTKLPVAHGAYGAISPDGQWLAYAAYAEGRTEHKMHYKGGLAPDIWLVNLRSRQSSKVTDWIGTDTSPMWHEATLYYLSDAGPEQRRNIWSYELKGGRRRQLTHFKDFDIKWPSIGPGPKGGGEIVFIDGVDLYLLDLATERTRQVSFTLPADRIDSHVQSVDASKFIANWSLSPTGAQAAVEARGRIWIAPAANGSSPSLLTHGAVAERYPVWSPDRRWIAYFSDLSGECQLYVAPSDRSTAPKRLTSLGPGFRFTPAWSPDSENITFSDSSGAIYLYSLKTSTTKSIHEDPLVRQPRLSWSPDSSWLAFTGSRDSMQVIWFYDTQTDKVHQVTGGGYNDDWPTFDRNGDYLFFVSNRNYNGLTYDSVDYSNFIYPSTELLMALPLRSGVPSPDNKSVSQQPENPPKRLVIDFDQIERRAVVLASEVGTYSDLAVFHDGSLLYKFSPPGAGPSLKRLSFGAPETSQTKLVLNVAWDFGVSGDGKKVFIREGNGIVPVDPISGQKEPDAIAFTDMSMEVSPAVEWKQVFVEAWRLYRDFFYDPKMRGVNWPAMRDKYAVLLQVCGSREDLDYVIGEMLAELGSSHVYLNPPGATGTPAAMNQEARGMLGVDFSVDHGAYQIRKIYDGAASEPTTRNPLRQPGVDVQEGDYLLAVNGNVLNTKQDPWAAFLGLAGKNVALTVSRKPVVDADARTEVVKPGDLDLVYRHEAWVESNRSYVDHKTSGRVGYVYLKMTSEFGFREFTRQFGPQLGKEALILDARWNQGGHIPYYLLDILRRQPYFYSEDMRRAAGQKNYFLDGPKCVLINGVTESGGDLLADLVQQSAVGKLVGTRTMGAMVGAGGLNIPFIDGGYSLVPTVGFYDVSGKWIVEGHGVAPDVQVADDPAAMVDGADPQLDAAIKLIMSELCARPRKRVVQPPFGHVETPALPKYEDAKSTKASVQE
jgi:tricorn protease